MNNFELTKPLKLTYKQVSEINEDCLVIFVSEEEFCAFLEGGSFDTKNILEDDDYDAIQKFAESQNFTAKCGQTLHASCLSRKSKVSSLILYGIGKIAECTECKSTYFTKGQHKGSKIADLLSKFQDVSFLVTDKLSSDIVCGAAFGLIQKLYHFSKYLTSEKKLSTLPKTKTVNIISETPNECCITNTNHLINSIYLVRDLVNEPANVLYPESYAEIIKDLLKGYENVKVSILDVKDLQKLGMNALLGVGMGSDKEPCVAVIEYTGNDEREEYDLALVGKGVTFDSGGLSIKPANSMEDMKGDMAGSAVVVAQMRLLAARKAKVNAVGIVGLVENTINGMAQKPGDIVRSMSGQTIEVLNTDAEGRLVLADILYYAKTKYNPDTIIDLATLTGAIVIALGDIYAGLFTNNECLKKGLVNASMYSGEKIWNLPLDNAYDKLMDSKIADMKNISGQRGAGSITAAQFLQRFIDSHPKWAHIDIAGVSGSSSGGALFNAGASGFGIKLLDAYIENSIESCEEKSCKSVQCN